VIKRRAKDKGKGRSEPDDLASSIAGVETSLTGISESKLKDFLIDGFLVGPIEVSQSQINGRTVSGWQVQRDEQGRLDSSDGRPSLVHASGLQEWHEQGRLHREDLPARIHPDGRLEFWKNGEFKKMVLVNLLPAAKEASERGS